MKLVLDDENYHQQTVSITNQNPAYDESLEFGDKKGKAVDRNTPLYDKVAFFIVLWIWRITFLKGKQLFREKKYEEGIKYLKDSLENEERTTEALYLLGVSYLWLGQYANAIKVFVLKYDNLIKYVGI